MKKLFGAMFLTGAIVVLSQSPNFAQSKKDDKPTKAAKVGTIELLESKDGKYRFNVRDAEGRYLGGSTVGHATEKEAKDAVEEMKKVMATANYVSKKHDDLKKDDAKKGDK